MLSESGAPRSPVGETLFHFSDELTVIVFFIDRTARISLCLLNINHTMFSLNKRFEVLDFRALQLRLVLIHDP